MNELLSLVLSLAPQPAPAPADREAPLWWARAAHALLLDVVRRENDVLADSLHEPPPRAGENPSPENTLRPFTVSTLMGRFDRAAPRADQTYLLRLTSFHEEVTRILWQAAQAGRLAPGAVIELDYLPFLITAVQPSAQPPADQPASAWAGYTSYAELSAAYLLAKVDPPRRVKLVFTSPTTFKSGGMHVPVPLPGLVFGSLLDRWNAYAPVTFPPEVKRYAESCLAISQYQLSSRPVPMKSGGLRMGGVGEVTYTTLNYDRYWMSVIAVLARFARYSGVGAGAAGGLGQCREADD